MKKFSTGSTLGLKLDTIFLIILGVPLLLFGIYTHNLNLPPINIKEICDSSHANEKISNIRCAAAMGMAIGVRSFYPFTDTFITE